jgi:hypothetical protein
MWYPLSFETSRDSAVGIATGYKLDEGRILTR